MKLIKDTVRSIEINMSKDTDEWMEKDKRTIVNQLRQNYSRLMNIIKLDTTA